MVWYRVLFLYGSIRETICYLIDHFFHFHCVLLVQVRFWLSLQVFLSLYLLFCSLFRKGTVFYCISFTDSSFQVFVSHNRNSSGGGYLPFFWESLFTRRPVPNSLQHVFCGPEDLAPGLAYVHLFYWSRSKTQFSINRCQLDTECTVPSYQTATQQLDAMIFEPAFICFCTMWGTRENVFFFAESSAIAILSTAGQPVGPSS